MEPNLPMPLECRDVDALFTRARRAGDDEAPRDLVRSLHDHLAACARCAAEHGGRLAGLESTQALRERSLPNGVLDDLWENVSRRLPEAPVGGAMSLAFLDAPRALGVWRAVAVAATTLLVVGTGLLVSGVRPGEGTPTAERLHAVPENLLHVWDASLGGGPRGEDLRIWPGASTRGYGPFYRVLGPDGEVPIGDRAQPASADVIAPWE